MTVQSPSLQGTRTTKTSENGDYNLPLLPPGEYSLVFELSRFSTQKKTATVAVTEPVTSTSRCSRRASLRSWRCRRTADAFATTIQSATNVKQELLNALPTARTILSAANLSPSVHATGPDGNLVISGAMSYESLYLVNGVQIQDNLRREPLSLFIEDAVQETTVSTSGHLRGIRTVHRRHRERDHPVGQQHARRFVPGDVHQRRLADGVAVQRAEDERRRADLRVHARRPGLARSHLVLLRRAGTSIDRRPSRPAIRTSRTSPASTKSDSR